MTVDSVAQLLKFGGILTAVVGFAIMLEWYEEASNVGAIIMGIGGTAFVFGLRPQLISAVMKK
jgi:hypothetical protein